VIEIEIANEQSLLEVDERRLCQAARQVLEAHGFQQGEVSLAIVDDAAIHRLNREYLAHDYPTDVLSFTLHSAPGLLQGQIVASAETALDNAPGYGWSAQDELLLYIVHGSLHLAGMDDAAPEDAARMRAAEARFLAPFGLVPAVGGQRAGGPTGDEAVDADQGERIRGASKEASHGERSS
jgi:probable rRNA maturation factor